MENELEVLTPKTSKQLKGGMTIGDIKTIVNFMTQNNLTSLTSGDLALQNLSFDTLINYSYSPVEHNFTLMGHQISLGGPHQLQTTIPPVSNGDPDVLFKTEGGNNLISLDNGKTWIYALNTVQIDARKNDPLYPLESQPAYDFERNTFEMAVTTLNDYNFDNIASYTTHSIAAFAGKNYDVVDKLISSTFSDKKLVRASVNDLLIDAMNYEYGPSTIITHPSGPSTLMIHGWSEGVSQLTVYLQNTIEGLYIELSQRGILTFGEDGKTLSINKDKYFQYRDGGAFDDYLINHSVNHPIE